MNPITEARNLTAALRAKTGKTIGIAVKQGSFAVTSTTKEGRKFKTEQLTGWQSHAECLDYMRSLAG